jgi:hypothetical protein
VSLDFYWVIVRQPSQALGIFRTKILIIGIVTLQWRVITDLEPNQCFFIAVLTASPDNAVQSWRNPNLL